MLRYEPTLTPTHRSQRQGIILPQIGYSDAVKEVEEAVKQEIPDATKRAFLAAIAYLADKLRPVGPQDFYPGFCLEIVPTYRVQTAETVGMANSRLTVQEATPEASESKTKRPSRSKKAKAAKKKGPPPSPLCVIPTGGDSPFELRCTFIPNSGPSLNPSGLQEAKQPLEEEGYELTEETFAGHAEGEGNPIRNPKAKAASFSLPFGSTMMTRKDLDRVARTIKTWALLT